MRKKFIALALLVLPLFVCGCTGSSASVQGKATVLVKPEQAVTLVEKQIGDDNYKVKVVQDYLLIEDSSYIIVAVKDGTLTLEPQLAVDTQSGVISCYYQEQGRLADYAEFPLYCDREQLDAEMWNHVYVRADAGQGIEASVSFGADIGAQRQFLLEGRQGEVQRTIAGAATMLDSNHALYTSAQGGSITFVKVGNILTITVADISGQVQADDLLAGKYTLRKIN